MAISPAIAAAAPSPVVDDTVAEFGSGTPRADSWIVEPGELRVKPTTLSATLDAALPIGWTATSWSTGLESTPTFTGGSLSVDGVRVHDNIAPSFGPGQVLEFRGKFSADVNEHVGLGNTFNETPWAMFSTGNGEPAMPYGLWARTQAPDGAVAKDELIAAVSPAESHTYRIEWSTTDVKFFVDGLLKTTHVAPWSPASRMRPVVSDYNSGIGALTVDYLGMSPAAGTRTGRFESRVHSADDAKAVWGTLTGFAGVAFETRTGNTTTPNDGSWSAYQALGAGNAIQSPPGRNIQYGATLTTGAGNNSPSLDRVSISYAIDTTAPTASIDGVDVSGATAALRFSSSSNDVARFECSLDGGGFAACTSPKQFAGLSAGAHTASVKAVDRVGNEGQVLSQGFTITPASGGVLSANTPDTLAPKVKIAPRSVRASRRGIVRLGVTCPIGEVSCEVDLKLKRGGKTVARKVKMVDGGETMEFKLTLKQAARLRLAERGRLNVTAVAKTEDAAGNRKKVKRNITLRPHTS